MAGGGEEATTPTWVVAVVYTVIVGVSSAAERLLYKGGEILKKKNKTALYDALQKIKEELMLLGFISLLLTVLEKRIVKICVSPGVTDDMTPCWTKSNNHSATVGRLLAAAPASDAKIGYCAAQNKVPLISVKAIHDLHIFIFTLAVVHVIYCVLTVFIGELKIRHWRHWEPSNAEADQKVLQRRSTHDLMTWLHSFCKQFYDSINESEYVTLRLDFMKTGKQNNPKLNFHKHTIEALEKDFQQVVGISWYLWIFVVIFFLINVNGWYTYFWIAFIPFLLLLAVGTKLEHVLIQLVHEVAARHADDGIESQSNVFQQSDDHFWFHRPSFVLSLIHFILFQNSFEIAFFFWIGLKAAYSFDACVMGKFGYIVFRLIIGVLIQVLCSYNTLPLYALLTQMRKQDSEEELQKKGRPC